MQQKASVPMLMLLLLILAPMFHFMHQQLYMASDDWDIHQNARMHWLPKATLGVTGFKCASHYEEHTSEFRVAAERLSWSDSYGFTLSRRQAALLN